MVNISMAMLVLFIGSFHEQFVLNLTKPSATQNLALGKPAYQSRTGFHGLPSRVVDGNTDGKYTRGSCSNTGTIDIDNAWWKVDLGNVYVIDHVTVYNRVDCCVERLQHVIVSIGLHDNKYTSHGYHPEAINVSYTFQMPPYVYGRWVKITRVNGTAIGALAMCEVQVMGNEISNFLRFKQGKVMIGTGDSLGSIQASSKGACILQCKITDKCVAVNFFAVTETCVKLETVSTTIDSNESNNLITID